MENLRRFPAQFSLNFENGYSDYENCGSWKDVFLKDIPEEELKIITQRCENFASETGRCKNLLTPFPDGCLATYFEMREVDAKLLIKHCIAELEHWLPFDKTQFQVISTCIFFSLNTTFTGIGIAIYNKIQGSPSEGKVLKILCNWNKSFDSLSSWNSIADMGPDYTITPRVEKKILLFKQCTQIHHPACYDLYEDIFPDGTDCQKALMRDLTKERYLVWTSPGMGDTVDALG